VVRERAPLVVPDARAHPDLASNLAVRDLGVIAYAGVPLIVSDEAIGAFCAIDDKPRSWSKDDLELLGDLTASVISEVELRRAMRAMRDQKALTDALVEGLGDAVLAMDKERIFLIANQAARRIFAPGAEAGMPLPADWAGLHRSIGTDGSPLASEDGALVRALRGESTDGLTFTLQRPDSTDAVWVEATGRPVRDAQGGVIAGVAVYRDVTERLRRAGVYTTLASSIPHGAVGLFDREMRCLAADGGGLLEFGMAPPGLIGRTMHEIAGVAMSNPRFAPIISMFEATLAGESSVVEYVYAGRTLEMRAAPVRDTLARVVACIVLVLDVTERQQKANELRGTRDLLVREHALLEATLEHIADGIVLLDSERRILLANASYASMFGLPRRHLEGFTNEQFVAHVAPLAEDPESFTERFARREPTATFVLARPRRRVLRRTETAVRLPAGDCFLVTWHDVTSESDLLDERQRQLLVDALTGIANRIGAEKALAGEDERRKRVGSPLSVALFDIDHFKRVNDEFGHATGDEVLRLVATTLASQARASDTVARWGGEEFIAVLPGGLGGALAFCERARRAVERLSSARVERVTISAGAVELAPGESVADAVARADERLYDAKKAGRNRVVG
jgi:diguanylate cyclase (GGDEF)-like protein/PAS domain S-box-containing protein